MPKNNISLAELIKYNIMTGQKFCSKLEKWNSLMPGWLELIGLTIANSFKVNNTSTRVGVRNNALGMHFYNYVSRIFSLNEQREFQNKTSANQIQKCFEKQQNEYDQSENIKVCAIA